MRDLKKRIAQLEEGRAANGPVLIYQGETETEREQATAYAAGARGVVVFLSPLDYAL
jgi:hypothetical protein